ncbi:hypothetical protein FACS1894200_06310 [Spirochaetia bacterium]|nr:hypothetical protein FACS1894200_06310 [Spirochaetia bacterium]
MDMNKTYLKNIVFPALLVGVLIGLAGCSSEPQAGQQAQAETAQPAVLAKDKLAILPFSGGDGEQGETIAELFSYTDELTAVFDPIPRTSIAQAIKSEQKFQMTSGMTDPDTIAAIGHQLGAKYVVAGNITQLGSNNMLIISILQVEGLQQIAGDVQTYTKIEEILGRLPLMAKNIVNATKLTTAALPTLAIIPLQLPAVSGQTAAAADILAQILSVFVVRSGRYAVYPRTSSLEQVLLEHKNQTSGDTDDSQIARLGAGANPDFVLSCIARSVAQINMFNGSIINLETGVQEVGRSVNYANMDDGVRAMNALAYELTGVMIPSFDYQAAGIALNQIGATTAAVQNQKTYSVTVAPLFYGFAAVSPQNGPAGTAVSIELSPYPGYRLKSGSLKYSDGSEHSIAGNSFNLPAANVTVTAEFEPLPPDRYSVTIAPLYYGFISPSLQNGPAGTVVALAISPYPGYRLKSGSLKYNDGTEHPIAGSSFSLPAANVTVTAEFEPIAPTTYSVTTAPLFYGFVKPSVQNGPAGTVIALSVNPYPGYRLKSGSLKYNDGSGTEQIIAGSSFNLPAANVTVTAEFEPITPTTYSVITAPVLNGSVKTNVQNGTAGTVVNVTVNPASGYQLKAGTLKYNDGTNHSIAGSSFSLPAANVTVMAEFEPIAPTTYSVTTTPVLNGSVKTNVQNGTAGTVVNVTVNPASGYQLKAGTLKYNDGSNHSIAGSSFSLPAANVTVMAEFEAVSSASAGAPNGGNDSTDPGKASDVKPIATVGAVPTGQSDNDFEVIQNTDGKTLVISKYKGTNKQVTIPETLYGLPVTSIGSGAFQGNQLTSVTIPNSVTTIGGNAFNSNRLTSITIPNSIITIGDSAFSNNRLTSITIPNSIITIGDYVFTGNQLTSVTIPNSVTTIGYSAFSTNKLTSITIPNSVTIIRGNAFSNNQLTSVTIPNSVTSIGGNAFNNNPLTSVTIGTVRSVGVEPGFDNFYISQNRAAGTYVKNGPFWSKQ